MNPNFLGGLPACLVLAVVGSSVVMVSGQEKKAASGIVVKATVEQLITDLDSENFKVRDAAARELLRREGVTPALYKAIIFPKSLESQQRIKGILQELESRHTPQRLQDLKALIRQGRVDEFVDLMAFLGERVDDECWEELLGLAKKLGAKAQKEHRIPIPFLRIDDIVKRGGFKRILYGGTVPFPVARKPEVLSRRLIVSQNALNVDGIFSQNIVFAAADIKCDLITDSIILCDGNVPARGLIERSLVVTRGTVKCSLELPSNVIAKGVREFMGIIHFYELEQSGIELKVTKQGLLVDKIVANSPFGKCGIREGDEILAWDKVLVKDLDSLRLLVRKSSVTTQVGYLTISRRESGKLKVVIDFASNP